VYSFRPLGCSRREAGESVCGALADGKIFLTPVGPPGRMVLRGFLLPLQGFVDRDLAALFYADDLVDGLEPGQRDVHHVVPRPQHELRG